MKTRTIFATVVIPATAVGLFAQENVTIRAVKIADEATTLMAQGPVGMVGLSSEPGNFRFVTQEFSFNGRVVTNAPYSADEKTESVQTLGDGNRITNTTTARVYRDSLGRTRREMTLPGFGGDAPHTIVTITDPVSGVNYTFDPQTKVAHEMPGPNVKLRAEAMAKLDVARGGAGMEIEAGQVAAQAKMKAEAEAKAHVTTTYIRRAPAPNTKHDDLGSDVIEGVSATGTRETSTIEAGAMGNEKPIVISSERWYSPDLQTEVKSVHSDPRMGTTTHTLSNINRSEPDATLFQVPADYKLEDGKLGPVQRFEVHSNQ